LGAGAGLLFSGELAMLPNPRSKARMIAAERFLAALQRIDIVIVSSFLFLISVSGPRSTPKAQTLYSTLLTFPLFKVTFMSL
jgi:hypothetical protein